MNQLGDNIQTCSDEGSSLHPRSKESAESGSMTLCLFCAGRLSYIGAHVKWGVGRARN